MGEGLRIVRARVQPARCLIVGERATTTYRACESPHFMRLARAIFAGDYAGESWRRYLDGFDRCNLIEDPDADCFYTPFATAPVADWLMASTYPHMVLCGGTVREAFGFAVSDGDLPRHVFRTMVERSRTYWLIPHPSGRNRWWHDQTNRDLFAAWAEQFRAAVFNDTALPT